MHPRNHPSEVDLSSSSGDRGAAPSETKQKTAADIRAWLVSELASRLYISPEEIDVNEPFVQYGLDSAEAVILSGDLGEWLGRDVPPTLVWDYPTIEEVARYLGQSADPEEEGTEPVPQEPDGGEAIAIVGIGCRFPGADSPQAFWRLLRDGVDAVSEVPSDRWEADDWYDPDPAKKAKMNTRWGGFLERVDQFDYAFFGISPREAELMDPQQRLLLEVAWEALEDAGQPAEKLAGSKTGVFIGISNDDYARMQKGRFEQGIYAATGNAFSVAANRISYWFDFQGPSMAIDTACSSSLVAVHLACRSLQTGESTLALAGGVNVILSPELTAGFSQAGMMASDGRCKTFDSRADGYVRGEGAGIVVLKPLTRALADGDRIYAVIRGSAVNQDGRTNGLTAPNQHSQEQVLREAYRNAAISPGRVQYIEAHGTGTPLGDPIEVKALGRVLSEGRPEGSVCKLGSVKTNIGHLESAAGIAGLIKAALMLWHREMPPSLHYHDANPHIPFGDVPLRVQQTLEPWPDTGEPAVAGVSSFGFGGTNAHVVLEEAPRRPEEPKEPNRDGRSVLIPLSARDDQALHALARAYRDEVFSTESGANVSLEEIGFTAGARRSHHAKRLAVVGNSCEELKNRLDAFLNGESDRGVIFGQVQPDRKLAFVFSGQGAQWWGMGRTLYEREPVFRSALEECDGLFRPLAGWSLVDELLADEGKSRLDETEVVQPLIFALQVALARLWESFGIKPGAVVGHSMGEVAAAHVAGALTLEDAVRVIFHRGRLMQTAKGLGKMAAVELSVAEAEALLAGYEGRLWIGAANGPDSTVLSGDPDALDEVVRDLQERGVFVRYLRGEYAFHSGQMEPFRKQVTDALTEIRPKAAAIPIASTVTGHMTEGEAFDAEYWGRNVREPVRFDAAVTTLIQEGYTHFLEIGPHPVLSAAILSRLERQGVKGQAVPSLRRNEDGSATLIHSLGILYALGYPIHWKALYPDAGRPVTLPTYPWQRERCWSNPEEIPAWRTTGTKNRKGSHPLLASRLPLAESDRLHYWQTVIGSQSVPWLEDHQVQGVVVMPGTGYVEMALAAAREVTAGARCELSGIRFEKALFLPEGVTRTLQVRMTVRASDDMAFAVYSRSEAEKEWTRHASGTIRVLPEDRMVPEGVESPERIRERCPAEVASSDHYLRVREEGLEYGPGFQGVTQLWKGDGEALGRVEIPPSLQTEMDRYRFHPALFDACLQVMAVIPSDVSRPGEKRVYMPVSVGRIRVWEQPGTEVWSHARIRKMSERSPDVVEGDLILYDPSGRVVAEVSAFRVERLDQTAQGASREEGLYEVRFEPSERVIPETASPAEPGCWLIFADGTGVGENLASLLAHEGECPVLVVPGDAYERLGESTFRIRPDAAEEIRRVVHEGVISRGTRFRGIVHLWNLDVQGGDGSVSDLRRAEALTLHSVVGTVQVLKDLSPGPVPRMWLVTCGSQSVGDQPEPVAAFQSPVWGLGRTLMVEHPDLWGGMVDLDPDSAAEQSASELFGQITVPDREDQVAFRGGQRYAARLVRRSLPDGDSLPLRWRTDASYLVTGGTGELGLLVARWMVQQGARRLILVGRTPLPSRAEWNRLEAGTRESRITRAIRELEALGASVHVATVDVADEEQMAAYLTRYREEGWPPIRGVVHAAGVAEVCLLAEQDPDSFSRVLRPKVQGSWVLHQLFRDEPLDFFVLFSSVSSLFSSARLGSYAAANAFLDALAHHRRAQGLEAVSINWGPWAELGMAARANRETGMTSGMIPISPEQGLEVLERLLRHRPVQTVVVHMDWQWWAKLFSQSAAPPFLADLMRKEHKSPDADPKEKEDVRTRLLALAPDRRAEWVETRLRGEVARVLKLSEDRLDVNQPLSALGLDSMMAVELKNRLETEWGLVVPMVHFLQGPSIRELSARLLEQVQTAEPVSSAPVVQSRGEVKEYPLSVNQRSFWFLHRLAPDSSAYHVSFSALIRSEIDVSKLKRAFRILVDRHDPLRSTIQVRGGEPVQVVHDGKEIHFEETDASGWTDEALRARMKSDYRRPFVLEEGPLFRVFLYRRAPEEHVLLLVAHHIVLDLWGLVVLLDEFRTVYAQLEEGRDAVLPPLRLRYADYVRWQTELLSGPEGQRQWEYWRNRLSGELPVLELPTDRPRPPVQTYNGASHLFRLSGNLTQSLTDFARREGTTLYTLMLAAFQTMLHRYTSQTDLLVGSPAAARSRPEFEGLVGDFTNMLVYRADFSDNPTFREFLKQVRQTVLEALDHQDYPFPLLVDRLQPKRDASRSPIFQVAFGLQKLPRFEELSPLFAPGREDVRVALGGLVLEPFELSQQEGQFDLTLEMGEVEGAIVGLLKYNTDLFEEETIRRVAGHFRTLLEGILENPDRPVGELPLLTKEERDRLLARPEREEAEPAPVCMHELFEKAAATRPDAEALVFGGERLTYRELNARANRLAHRLQALGVGPETRVGICMDRSVELIVAILGVLKAGGAYVPLDPSYPADRLAFMTEDAGVALILTRREQAERIGVPQAQFLYVDEQGEESGVWPEENPVSGVTPDNLAYIIYTSGSTGKPKGVLVTHRGLGNVAREQIRLFDVRPDSRILQFASISFDASVFELVMAWGAGAALCLAPREQLLPGPGLITVLKTHAVTHVTLPPSVLAAMPEAELPALRLIITAGEALSQEIVKRWRTGNRRLFNAYGPTETTIWATVKECFPDEEKPLIGKPIAHTRLYVLDAHRQPVPVGVPGELYIESVGLARGYLGRPEQTEKHFVPHPFRDEPGARLYRTGDLVRLLPDGNLDFLGRVDHQVKIRGYRIELSEIESALTRHSEVRDAVVAVREDTPGMKLLVAYVVPAEGAACDPRVLRADLAQRLPDYMIPSAFVRLPALPLTPNGKVDRRALPVPDAASFGRTAEHVEPASDLERMIAEVWREVLHLDRVGVKDHFFELGGNSILLAAVHARLCERVKPDLKIVDLFQYPTVRALAEFISRSSENRAEENREEVIQKGKDRLKKRMKMRQGAESK